MNIMKEQPKLEIDKYGNKKWYLNGKLHREDGPAKEWKNGYKKWYLNGKLQKIQHKNIIAKRDKTFDCQTYSLRPICQIDCQYEILNNFIIRELFKT